MVLKPQQKINKVLKIIDYVSPELYTDLKTFTAKLNAMSQ